MSKTTKKTNLENKLNEILSTFKTSAQFKNINNYILLFIFYKYISDITKNKAEQFLNGKTTYENAWQDESLKLKLQTYLLEQNGYYIAPEDLYENIVNLINENNFKIATLEKSLLKINNSLAKALNNDNLNLLKNINLQSHLLSPSLIEREKIIINLILKINELTYDISNNDSDILGDAYEFLISKFALTIGKDSDFYTPKEVSKLLAKIVSLNKNEINNAYDPTFGTGSLLLKVYKEIKTNNLYGQELNEHNYNLAVMNLILHQVPFDKINIALGNTLEEPKYLNKKFDAIVSHPPYNESWSADKSFLTDERFKDVGRLAPRSRSSFAFIQHMLYLLEDNGTLAVVQPHGVLFRGAAEEVIRKHIVEEKNYLDAVIGLPENIFYGTGIPTVILIFKKSRNKDDKVLFIDASNDYVKDNNKNYLTDKYIDKIIQTYQERKVIDKYSYEASLEEIKQNDCNLNIPRYIDTFKEEVINVEEIKKELNKVEKELEQVEKEIKEILNKLNL